MLPTIGANPVNSIERSRAIELDKKVKFLIGNPSFKYGILRQAAKLMAFGWKLRLRLIGDVIQPKTIFTEFRQEDRKEGTLPIDIVPVTSLCNSDLPLPIKKVAFSAIE